MELMLPNFVVLTTVLAVFSEGMVVHAGVDLKLFYVVVALNFVLLSRTGPMPVHTGLLAVLAFLGVTGAAALALGSGDARGYVLSMTGIAVVALYYYAFLRRYRDDVSGIFEFYTHVAVGVSLLGVAMSVVQSRWAGEWVPVQSIMLEPAHFATVVMPAFALYARRIVAERRGWVPAAALAAAIVLSGSSVGIIGLMLSVMYALRPRGRNVLVAFLLGAALFAAAYSVSPGFRMRVDDTATALLRRDLTGVNHSSYSLVKNFFVALDSVERNPILGSGLGSHQKSHDAMFGEIAGTDEFAEDARIRNLNAKDAGSLFSRVLSELGLAGLVAVFAFIWYFRTPGNPISAAIQVYFWLKLLRDGHYFSPEVFYFVMTYLFVHWSRAATPVPAPTRDGAGSDRLEQAGETR